MGLSIMGVYFRLEGNEIALFEPTHTLGSITMITPTVVPGSIFISEFLLVKFIDEEGQSRFVSICCSPVKDMLFCSLIHGAEEPRQQFFCLFFA